jgi:hypothetical protein
MCNRPSAYQNEADPLPPNPLINRIALHEQKIRTLARATPFVPFVIVTGFGARYRVPSGDDFQQIEVQLPLNAPLRRPVW